MPDALDYVRQEVAIANRILANEGIIDAFGHISMRHPTNPKRYFISRHRASELVDPDDVLECDLDSKPVKATSAVRDAENGRPMRLRRKLPRPRARPPLRRYRTHR